MARTDQPHKVKFDSFVARATDWNNPKNEKHRDLDYSRPETAEAFNGYKSTIPIWCNTHNKFFRQLVGNHLALGQGCPECGPLITASKRRKVGWLTDFNKVHGSTYDYSKVIYKSTHERVEIICKKHGSWLQEPNAHMAGAGCPECHAERKVNQGADLTAQYIEDFPLRAKEVHGCKYTYIGGCTGSHSNVTLRCETHGIFMQKAYSHLQGIGCPKCGNVTPYTQLKIAQYIRDNGVEVEDDNKDSLNGKHIDIWIPSKRVGIEYHGSYWHTEARRGRLHRDKWKLASDAGIRLIQVFDFEWINKEQAVKNRLSTICGFAKRSYARQYELKKVSNTDAAEFYDIYHTQGGAGLSGHSYGLYKGKDLMACATFSEGRYNGEEYELRRYASIGQIIGGFARIFKKFRLDRTPKEIISYCDLRWGDGTLYKNNGFQLLGITDPDYWYTTGDNKISRYSVQNRPAGMTEREYVAQNSYQKVLGVGHQKWKWTAQ